MVSLVVGCVQNRHKGKREFRLGLRCLKCSVEEGDDYGCQAGFVSPPEVVSSLHDGALVGLEKGAAKLLKLRKRYEAIFASQNEQFGLSTVFNKGKVAHGKWG